MTATTTRRPKRHIPVVPRPRTVIQPNGKRGYPAVRSNPLEPPPGRPRFAHQRLAEEFHGELGLTYRVYPDDLVAVYGRSNEGAVSHEDAARAPDLPYRDWVVTVWRGHPLLTPRRARLVRYLADKVTYAEALATLDDWELNGSGDDA